MQIRILDEENPEIKRSDTRRGAISNEKPTINNPKQQVLQSRSFSIKVEPLPSELSITLPDENLLHLKKKQKVISALSAFISVIIIMFSYISAETYFSNNYSLSSQVNSCRFIIMISSFIQDALIFFYYTNHLEIKKAYKEVYKSTTIFQDPYTKKQIIVELLISLPFIPPFVQWHTRFYQLSTYTKLSLDDFFLSYSFLRLSHIIKFLYEILTYNSPKAKFYCSLQNTKFTISFTLKCINHASQLWSILIVSCLVTFLCGMLLRTYEQGIPNTMFEYFWNSLWTICITETTVGYGDYVPLSHIGRMICVISAVYGLFMYSMIIITVNEKVRLNEREILIYKKMKYKHKIAKVLRPVSTKVIQKWWKLMSARKKGKFSFKDVASFHVELKNFKYKKAILHSQASSSLEDQASDVAMTANTKLTAIRAYLLHARSYQQMGSRFIANQYSILNKITSFKSKLEKITNAEPASGKRTTTYIPRFSRASFASSGEATPKTPKATLSKAQLKMQGELAVKKMLQTRMDSHGSRTSFSYVSNSVSRRSSNISQYSHRSSISPGVESVPESM